MQHVVRWPVMTNKSSVRNAGKTFDSQYVLVTELGLLQNLATKFRWSSMKGDPQMLGPSFDGGSRHDIIPPLTCS